MKLTPAQAELLDDLSKRQSYVWENYGPLKALLKRGYVEMAGDKWSPAYRITEAGRQALKEQGETP